MTIHPSVSGLLLINKPKGKTSFYLVSVLRKIYQIKKIGHAGTLDPFATGVMIYLVGRSMTKLSDHFLCQDKEYEALLHLGIETDTFDCEGEQTPLSNRVPTLEEIKQCIDHFQGEMMQTPPMYSAKKVGGKKLYELARKGITIEREAKPITIKTTLLSYEYPFVKIHVSCSKGTYLRSIAYDMGKHLGVGAHLTELTRTRCGPFHLHECIDGSSLSIHNPPALIPCCLEKK